MTSVWRHIPDLCVVSPEVRWPLGAAVHMEIFRLCEHITYRNFIEYFNFCYLIRITHARTRIYVCMQTHANPALNCIHSKTVICYWLSSKPKRKMLKMRASVRIQSLNLIYQFVVLHRLLNSLTDSVATLWTFGKVTLRFHQFNILIRWIHVLECWKYFRAKWWVDTHQQY